MEVDSGSKSGIGKDMIAAMNQASQTLSKNRKKRIISPELVTVEGIKNFKMRTNTTLHKAAQPGILCMDLHPTDSNLVLTGGMDHNLVLYSRNEQSVGHALTFSESGSFHIGAVDTTLVPL